MIRIQIQKRVTAKLANMIDALDIPCNILTSYSPLYNEFEVPEAYADQVTGIVRDLTRIRVHLSVMDKKETAVVLKKRLLYDGPNMELAQHSYEAACVAVEEASGHIKLKVTMMECLFISKAYIGWCGK